MLTVKAEVLEAIVAHARAARPEECCGLLLGRGDTIEEARPAQNISERPTARFLINPKDHIRAIREGRRHGLEVVGFYHSHPHSPPEPSDTDRSEAGWLDALYLIVSLASGAPTIGLFHLSNGNFRELPLVTVA